jgi:hypothetical protein
MNVRRNKAEFEVRTFCSKEKGIIISKQDARRSEHTETCQRMELKMRFAMTSFVSGFWFRIK